MTTEITEHLLRFACPVCGAQANTPCNTGIWNRQFARSILLAPSEVHEGRKAAAVRHVINKLKGTK